MKCENCGRRVTSPQWEGGRPYGSTCHARLFPKARAASVKRRRRVAVPEAPASDPRQMDFFTDDLQFARRVDALLSSISLEV